MRSGDYPVFVIVVEDDVLGEVDFVVTALIGVHYPEGRSAGSDLDAEGYLEIEDFSVMLGDKDLTLLLTKKLAGVVIEAIKDNVADHEDIPDLQWSGLW